VNRLLPEEFLDSLPKNGLVVSHKNVPVAVAFLRVVEGGMGMIDGFLADPDVDIKIRNECLDELISDIIRMAEFNGMNGVIGLSVNKRVIARAKRLGFSIMEHKLVSLKWATGTKGTVH